MPKVLIIEDNQRVADILSKFLGKKGLESDIVNDGISAMRYFVGQTYDLLLVNLELSFMNGDALSRKIRESAKGKDIPIIMMSGSLKDDAEIGRLTREIGLTGFLTKPFTSDALAAMLSSILPDSASSETVEPSYPAPPAPEKPVQAKQPQALKGNLETTPFEKVLLYLLKKRGTGTLTASRDEFNRVFFFIDGGLAEIETTSDEDDFGYYLNMKKLADEVEVREYRERRKRDGGDPRDIFIMMGCLSPRQLLDESRNFLYDRLLECFSWRSGSVLFEWAQPFMAVYPVAPAFMPLVFYRGFKTKLTPEEITSFLQANAARYAARTPDFYEYQNHLSGEGPVAEVLDVIDGRKTGKDIIGSRDENEAGLVLYTLEYLDLITFTDKPQTAEVAPPFPIRERRRQPARESETETFEDLGGALSALEDEVAALEAIKPAPATAAETAAGEGLSDLEQDLRKQWESVKDKNYYEIFGMKQNTFAFDKLKKAYFEYTRSYGPDKFFASSSEIMSLAEELLSRISNAYETLSNVVTKENYDEMLASQEQVPSAAEDKEFYEQIQFQSGKVFVEQGQYESAEKAFTNCVNIDPNKPEYLAYLAVAVYHNPATRGNPAARKRAKDLVNKSLQLGKLSIAYALKGTMYLDEGGINFAEAEFNKALKLNPNNKTALKKLEQIKIRREEEKKGLFTRMFK